VIGIEIHGLVGGFLVTFDCDIFVIFLIQLATD